MQQRNGVDRCFIQVTENYDFQISIVLELWFNSIITQIKKNFQTIVPRHCSSWQSSLGNVSGITNVSLVKSSTEPSGPEKLSSKKNAFQPLDGISIVNE